MTDGPTPAPLPLILCLPAPEAVPAAAALLPAGQPVADLAAAEAGLAAMPGARLVLICPAPAVWVAQLLAAGTAPAGAVAAWRQGLRPVMALLRTRRRQVQLRLFAGMEGSDPVLEMIAHRALARDTGAQALADELAASAWQPEEAGADLPVAEGPDSDHVFAAYGAVQAARAGHAAEERRLTAALALAGTEAASLRATLAAADRRAEAVERAQAAERAEAGARQARDAAEIALMRDQIRLETEAGAQLRAALDAAGREAGVRAAAHEAAMAEAGIEAERQRAELALLRGQIALAEQAAEGARGEALGLRDDLAALGEEAALLRDQARLAETALAAALEAQQRAEAGLADTGRRLAAAEAARASDRAGMTEAEGRHKAETRLLRDQIRLAEEAAGKAAQARAAAEAELARLTGQLTAGELAARRAAEEAATAARTAATSEESRSLAAEAARAALQAEAGLLRDQVRLDNMSADRLQAALVAAETRGREAQAQIARLREAQHKLETALEASRRETREARGQAEAEFSQMIGQLREQVFQTGQALAGHHSQLEALQAERADLMSQIEQVEGAREELEGYYDRARQFSGRIEALTGDIGRLQAEAEAARQALDDRTRQAEFLEAEIGRIHRSRSYRLTEPLRKIRSKTRK